MGDSVVGVTEVVDSDALVVVRNTRDWLDFYGEDDDVLMPDVVMFGLPRVFRTVELCYFMLRLARLDIRCGPGVGSGSLTRSGAVADYRRFQYSGQYLVSL